MQANILLGALLALVLGGLVAYTLLVTPKRFVQCLGAPNDYLRRYRGAGAGAALPEPVGGNQAELLVNGDEILPAMLDAIQNAEHTIRWQVMLFQPDEAGRALAEALIDAARRDVQVQLAFDIHQTMNGPAPLPYPRETRKRFAGGMGSMMQAMREAGIEILNSPPGIDFPLQGLSERARAMQEAVARSACISANHYDHRKVLIVDERLAIAGGMNIGREYLYRIPPEPAQDMGAEAQARGAQGLLEAWEKWQDTAVQVEGPAAASLAGEFDLRWEVLGGRPMPMAGTVAPAGEVPVQVLNQRPGLYEISSSYIDLIEGAQEEILVASPYVSHAMLLEALMAASRRGVRVVFVYPGEYNDVAISRRLLRAQTGALLEAGVEVYENNQRMTHSKLLVVDGQWASIGSFNLNHRSVNHDYELNLAIESEALARELAGRVFAAYLAQAERLTEPYDKRLRLLDWLLWPLT
jgi:cardiolipin synthase